MADVELTGVRELVAKLNASPRQVRQACEEGLYRFGEKIMGEAVKVTPKRTGALRASGRVEPPVSHWWSHLVSVKLKFGGAAAPYAIYVHEMTGAKVHWTTPGTGPKFLETPLKLYGTPAGVNQYLVPPIKRALERMYA